MILVGLLVVAVFQHAVVGKEFEIHAHLALHQPGKGIEPAEDGENLCHHHVERVNLLCMRRLMDENLIELLACMIVGIGEYPTENEKGLPFPLMTCTSIPSTSFTEVVRTR